MPCSDGGLSFQDQRKIERDELEKSRKLAKRAELAEVLLCSACRSLEVADFDFDINPALADWWDAHKKADQKREDAKKRARDQLEFEQSVIWAALKKPIEKLTGEELNLLKKHKYL